MSKIEIMREMPLKKYIIRTSRLSEGKRTTVREMRQSWEPGHPFLINWDTLC